MFAVEGNDLVENRDSCRSKMPEEGSRPRERRRRDECRDQQVGTYVGRMWMCPMERRVTTRTTYMELDSQREVPLHCLREIILFHTQRQLYLKEGK